MLYTPNMPQIAPVEDHVQCRRVRAAAVDGSLRLVPIQRPLLHDRDALIVAATCELYTAREMCCLKVTLLKYQTTLPPVTNNCYKFLLCLG